MYRHLLDMFRRDQAEGVARIRKALDSGDYDTAKLLAHTLKGLAGNIGAEDLVHAALAVEQGILGNNTRDTIKVMLAKLESALELVFDVIDEWPVPVRTTIQSVDTPTRSEDNSLTSDIPALYALLLSDDAEAPRRLEAMLPALSKHITAKELEHLTRSITHYKYETAAKFLLDISRNIGILLQ
jgi:two-component system, sensor histidine kinase and response regulator